jgi:succinyl-diaminopimelate desuccinylase
LEFIEACRKLISIDSTPAHGNKEVALWVAELCREKGLHVEVQQEFVGDTEQANVIVRPGPQRPEAELLLQTHLDTVDPGPFQLWTETDQNPFDATIRDGKIYGLGAADVKDRASWKLSPVLVGTFGEESGMQGALKLIRKNKVNAKMALIGEPSDLKVINAAKGYASVEVRVPFSQEEISYRHEHNLRESTSTQSKLFMGKPAHSSTPHLGESAIIKMLEHLMQLPDGVSVMEVDGGTNFNTVPSHALLELDIVSTIRSPIAQKIRVIYQAVKDLEVEFLKFQDKDFYPPQPTLNIGVIRTYEDHVMISGSCRIPPLITHEIYESWMGRLRDVCASQGSIFRVNDYKKPFRTDENSILVRGCQNELKAMNLNSELLSQPSTNEASIFSRTGVDCVCFGPGRREGNVHTPQEHVEIAALEKAVQFYQRIIERFCV